MGADRQTGSGGGGRADWNIDNGQAVAETNFRFWLQIKHVPQPSSRGGSCGRGLGLELMRIDAGGVCETCKNIFICSRLRIRSNWFIWPEPQPRHKSSSSQLQHKCQRGGERRRRDRHYSQHLNNRLRMLAFSCRADTFFHLTLFKNYSFSSEQKLISFSHINTNFHFNNLQKIIVDNLRLASQLNRLHRNSSFFFCSTFANTKRQLTWVACVWHLTPPAK